MTKKINAENKLKLLIALDLTEMDPILINYVSFLSQLWQIEHIYFVHNIKQYKIYDLYDEFLEGDITVEDIVDQALQKSIKAHYKGTVPHSVLITTDDYTESILTHLTEEYKIDVLIAGNKNELQGTGALCQKLVRMVDSHVLMIPEHTEYKMNKVLIPTDFSADSARCFPVAESAVAHSGGVVEALHVYKIPQVFFPYINTEKAHDKTKAYLKERVENFKKRHKISQDILFKYTDREDYSIVEAIEVHAEKGNFDLVIVSARGGNNITSLFIGSVTNDLLVRNRSMPLLVIR